MEWGVGVESSWRAMPIVYSSRKRADFGLRRKQPHCLMAVAATERHRQPYVKNRAPLSISTVILGEKLS